MEGLILTYEQKVKSVMQQRKAPSLHIFNAEQMEYSLGEKN